MSIQLFFLLPLLLLLLSFALFCFLSIYQEIEGKKKVSWDKSNDSVSTSTFRSISSVCVNIRFWMLRPLHTLRCVLYVCIWGTEITHKTHKNRIDAFEIRDGILSVPLSSICDVYRGVFHIDRLSPTRYVTLNLKYTTVTLLVFIVALFRRNNACICTTFIHYAIKFAEFAGNIALYQHNH